LEVKIRGNNEKILVIGAGTNGSIIAAALFNHGVNVTVLVLGKRYEEIKSGGIVYCNRKSF
jgi:ketopantoate reductase